MTFRDLCTKEIVQLQNGVCLGKADDLTFDPATARIENLRLLGQPKLFGLLGRDEELIVPWGDIETIGQDAILVHTVLPPRENGTEKAAAGESVFARLKRWLNG